MEFSQNRYNYSTEKIIFNLKIKSQIAPDTEGDLRNEDVENIAERLDVSEDEVVSMNSEPAGKNIL